MNKYLSRLICKIKGHKPPKKLTMKIIIDGYQCRRCDKFIEKPKWSDPLYSSKVYQCLIEGTKNKPAFRERLEEERGMDEQ